MDPSRFPIILALLSLSLAAGCASSPWASTAAPDMPAPAAVDAVSQPFQGPDTPLSGGSNDPSMVPNATGQVKTQNQMMQEVMAELQQLGVMDPKAQEELMQDLQQTDPEMWPLVMQQFRAAVAYRRRAQGSHQAAVSGSAAPRFALTSRPAPSSEARPQAPLGQPTRPVQTDSGRVGRLPTPQGGATAPTTSPPGTYPSTQSPLPPVDPRLPNRSADGRPAPVPVADQLSADQLSANPVIASSYNSADADNWQDHLASATRALEAEIQGPPATQEDLVRHARLRLLYALAGRRNDAVEPIPPIGNPSPGQGGPQKDQAIREFWSKQTHALATWLDVERTPNAMTRAGETNKILSEAVVSLGEAAPLEVSNLVFGKQLDSYGCYEEFETNRFMPGQEVLLYAEVENFSNEPTAKGFHISLQCRYAIYDLQGNRVAEGDLPETGGSCRNRRRDYFVAYYLRIPPHLNSSQYVLKLTVEDLKSKRIGESQFSFTVQRQD